MSDEQDYVPVKPVRKKKTGEEKPPQMARCWNGFWGCEGSFAIRKHGKYGQIVTADNYNPACRTCLTCCNREAADWNINFDDLPFLMSAMQYSRSVKGGETVRETVLDGLRQMGFESRPGRRMEHQPRGVDFGAIMSKAQKAMRSIPEKVGLPVPEHLR